MLSNQTAQKQQTADQKIGFMVWNTNVKSSSKMQKKGKRDDEKDARHKVRRPNILIDWHPGTDRTN